MKPRHTLCIWIDHKTHRIHCNVPHLENILNFLNIHNKCPSQLLYKTTTNIEVNSKHGFTSACTVLWRVVSAFPWFTVIAPVPLQCLCVLLKKGKTHNICLWVRRARCRECPEPFWAAVSPGPCRGISKWINRADVEFSPRLPPLTQIGSTVIYNAVCGAVLSLALALALALALSLSNALSLQRSLLLSFSLSLSLPRSLSCSHFLALPPTHSVSLSLLLSVSLAFSL